MPSAAECVLTVQVYRKGKPALVKSARTDPARLYSQGFNKLSGSKPERVISWAYKRMCFILIGLSKVIVASDCQ